MASGGGNAGGGGGVEWHVRPPNPKNPVVFFDITIGTIPAGRIKMELFADIAPKTAENFRHRHSRSSALASTEKLRIASWVQGVPVPQGHYRDFMIQAGDFLKGDGSGCASIYGHQFDDETFDAKHTGPGLLSMANSGPNTNGCQFFITCSKCDWLDNKHVVFGRVLGDGLLVVRKIENVATGPNNRPKLACVIAECGEIQPVFNFYCGVGGLAGAQCFLEQILDHYVTPNQTLEQQYKERIEKNKVGDDVQGNSKELNSTNCAMIGNDGLPFLSG
ncbi:unnamed protein product [Prunus armeniaca]|uniref:Peptidyl-prolyl cis-trans isomerase n=1 Tax=Prunus armeniaca TaxID=36596 RepID=A0A6J5WGD8_PRUAR|nr:unnamed protein product [Prunus armeniaca]